MKHALTIAGSDCSGGAGIQADLKTFAAHGIYGMSAIVSVVAENTCRVLDIQDITPDMIEKQIIAVFEDIEVHAVKVGMMSTRAGMLAVSKMLKQYRPKHVVIDPVMVATSGSRLTESEAVAALKSRLFPLAALVTPNLPEAEVLSGMTVRSEADMAAAAKYIGESCGCAVLLKGGHSVKSADDLLYAHGAYRWFRGRRIGNPNTHGTGCTLSSAVASNLAKGYDLETAVQRAKDYISGALAAMLDLGKGAGPLNHAFDLAGRFAEEK